MSRYDYEAQCEHVGHLGKRCTRKSHIPNEKNCPFHRVVRKNANKNGTHETHLGMGVAGGSYYSENNGLPTKEQMAYYIKHFGPKLKTLIEDALENTKLNDITEEIAVVRTAYLQACSTWSTLVELQDVDIYIAELGGGIDEASMRRGRQKLNEMTEKARQVVITGMHEIAVLCERQAKIHNLTVDKLPPDAIDSVVKQITRMVHINFAHDWQAIEAFDQMLNEELQLPSLKAMGTMQTPSQTCREMDDTIPMRPTNV